MSTTVTQQRLEREVFARIPLAAAMRLHIEDYSPNKHLVLGAPLTPNLNHEGIAFGGAIECIGTLACWGLVWLALDAPESLIVIQRCEVEFLKPIQGDLLAKAIPPDAEAWQHFIDSYTRHGCGRIDLTATIGAIGEHAETPEAARFHGRFVAKHKL